MTALTLSVDLGDGEQTYVLRPADIAAWEKHTGRTMADLGDSIGMGDLLFLAWRCATRGQDPRPDYETWSEDVEAVSPGPDQPRPTQPVPSTG